jgi:hypothetical protein
MKPKERLFDSNGAENQQKTLQASGLTTHIFVNKYPRFFRQRLPSASFAYPCMSLGMLPQHPQLPHNQLSSLHMTLLLPFLSPYLLEVDFGTQPIPI